MRSVTRLQLTVITVCVAAITASRFAYGPFSLQGVLFVLVTAIVASRFGPAAGVASTALGFAAVHVQLLIQFPVLLHAPWQMFTKQYFTGFGMYLLLSAAVIFVSH